MITPSRYGRRSAARRIGSSLSPYSFGAADPGVDLGLGKGFQFPAGMTPASYLTRQVNRFAGAKTPPAFPLPLVNVISSDVAFWAAALYNEAVQAARAAGTADDSDVVAANAAFMGPLPYVTSNIAAVSAMITGYANALKMPPASGIGPSASVMVAVVAGAVLLAVFILPKGTR